MSPMMVRFLKAWLAWSDARIAADTEGRVYPKGWDGFEFNDEYGLCSNSSDFHDAEIADGRFDYNEDAGSLYDELQCMFKDDCLDTDYPFGEGYYDDMSNEGTQYTCPVRREWVREKLA